MKKLSVALAVVAVAACSTQPAQPHDPAESAAWLNFASQMLQPPQYQHPTQQDCITMPNGLGGFNTRCY